MNASIRRWQPLVAAFVTLAFLATWTVFIWHDARTVEALAGQQKLFLIGMAMICLLLIAGALWNWFTNANVIGFLCACSILMAAGISYQFICGNLGHHFRILVVGIIAGAAACIVWRRINILSTILYLLILGGTVALLMLNIFGGIGEEETGAKLWVRIGSIVVQPGEFCKVGVILLGAVSGHNKWKSVVFCCLSIILCCTLVLLKDLGNAVIIFGVFLWMTYILFDNRVLSAGIAMVALAAFVVVVSLSAVAQMRMANFLHAMDMAPYAQQRQFITATIYGGFSGLGCADAHLFTDIFASENDGALAGIMAVFGHPGLLIVLGAYALLVLQAAFNRSYHPSAHLLLVQFAIYIFIHVMLNLGGALDFLPFTGIIAPLVSLGGSSYMSCCVLIGLCIAAMNPKVKERKVVPYAWL